MKNVVSESYELEDEEDTRPIKGYHNNSRGERVDLWLYWNGKKWSKEAQPINYWYDEIYKKLYDPDIYAWKKETGISFVYNHLIHFQDVLIHRYFELGFKIVLSYWRDKPPVDSIDYDKKGGQFAFIKTEREVSRYMFFGANIAVPCSLSGIIVLDRDRKTIPRKYESIKPLLEKTFTNETYHGYHYFFNADEVPQEVGSRFPDFHIRDKAIVVLPLSVHRVSKKEQHVKDLVYYKPVDYTRNLVDFSRVLNKIDWRW